MRDVKKKDKNTSQNSLQNSPNVDIGLVYSIDELNKYYEVKKLELFKLLLNLDKNPKEFQKYSKLANNYKNLIDYLMQNINYKRSIQKGKENNNIGNNNDQNNLIDTNITKTNTNNSDGGLLIKDHADKTHDRLLLGDPSFNLTFIPNYEIFGYFDLLFDVE